MKAAFALTLIFASSLSAAAVAGPGGSTDTCTLSGTAGDASAACKTLRATYWERMGDCLESPQDAFAPQGSVASAGSPQASRARYLLCAAEVGTSLGVASN